MAKRQLSIQDTVDSDDELLAYMEENLTKVICLEVYSEFCGPCLSMGNAVRKGKLEIGGDNVAMAKKRKLATILYGANGIELCRLIEELTAAYKKEIETGVEKIHRIDLSVMLPIEVHKKEEVEKLDKEYRDAAARMRILTLAARKKRVQYRLAPYVKRLNYILFWPHNHQAHYDLYEKWDVVNIQVSAKDEFQLTEDDIPEVLYMSDVDQNEACLYHLMNGPVLVVLFKMFDTDDRDFVTIQRGITVQGLITKCGEKLSFIGYRGGKNKNLNKAIGVLRKALYEDIPEPKEDVPPAQQPAPIPAFEKYATISKTAREVRRQRYNDKMLKLKEEAEEAERLRKETERLERQAEEERLLAEKQKKEEERMARIAAGLPASPEPEPEPEPVPEEVTEGAEGAEGAQAVVEGEGGEAPPEEAPAEAPPAEPAEGELVAEEGAVPEEPKVPEVFQSDVELEDEEYIPPGGLFVPGLYSPPNELAKCNGLKFFFPKIIEKYTPIETEYLPAHVLVMFTVDKRHEVYEIVKQYREEILAMGFFLGDEPAHLEHVAYTVKQYDKMPRLRKHLDRLALMVSRKRSLPLLQLAGLNPIYISSDKEAGEKECLQIFPVGYGDNYVEEESVVEEEIHVVEVKESVKVEAKPEENVEEEEEEEGD